MQLPLKSSRSQLLSFRSADAVVGISCAIVVVLFSVNYLGTVKLGACYAPIVLLWFLFNLITAIHNITVYSPGVFKAFSPYYGEPSSLSEQVILHVLLSFKLYKYITRSR